jgi:hypothetical protein
MTMNGIFVELYLDGSLPPKQDRKAKLAALLADRPILRTAAITSDPDVDISTVL